MTHQYAFQTEVPADKSRLEIERTLIRYGASAFGYMWEGNSVRIGFKMNGRQIKFALQMPDPQAKEFRFTPKTGKRRSDMALEQAYEQAVRQKWRSLVLVIKAKLEAIESGISTFENEFLANIMLPDGSTVSDFMLPQIERVYQTREMPRLLT
jgi:hypothetical protein